MHPRLTPGNRKVALAALKGVIAADRYVDGELCAVASPVADLLRSADGGLDCQLLRGAGFLVIERQNDFAFGQTTADGYCGYVRLYHLTAPEPMTHKVAALASHAYKLPDIKSRAIAALSFGSKLAVAAQTGNFAKLTDGHFVPLQHLKPITHRHPDFIAVFEQFLGIPYLWGGNSIWGMDCSGAVQLALNAAGIKCPRDTDMQITELGDTLPPDAPLQRGDLIFWQGHVGVMTDPKTLIHANAHHMAVAIEPLANAVARIQAASGGDITALKRL